MQYWIADALGTTSGGTEIVSIRDYLNQEMGYNNSSNRYAVKAFTQHSYDKALYYIRNSLYYDACPIFRMADTSYFNYYNGTSQTHYITISEYITSASIVKFVDPNYDVSYRGYHEITFDDLETAIYEMSYYENLDSFFVVRTSDYNTDAYDYIY